MVSRNKIVTTVYLEAEQDAALRSLTARTGKPMTEYIREGIDMVLGFETDAIRVRTMAHSMLVELTGLVLELADGSGLDGSKLLNYSHGYLNALEKVGRSCTRLHNSCIQVVEKPCENGDLESPFNTRVLLAGWTPYRLVVRPMGD